MNNQSRAPASTSKHAEAPQPNSRSKAGAREAPTAIMLAGNQAVQRAVLGQPVQAKLQVSAPGDPLEREADAVADQIMRMPDGHSSDIAISPSRPRPQRKCAECKEEEDEGARNNTVQRKETGGATNFGGATRPGDVTKPAVAPSTLGHLHGRGRQLPRDTQYFFESRMQRDFSGVRIHTDSHAGTLARDLQAKAFTHGHHIAFAPGQYNPHSHDGRRLLAHELTHTVQQQAPNGVYRDTMTPVPAELTLDESAEESAPQVSTEAPNGWSFDPYLENYTELTNLALINAILDTDDWLAEHEASETDHEAYRIKDGLLEDERVRRVGMGHLWLETVQDRQSYPLYQLVTGANGAFDVVAVENHELIYGEPRDVTGTPIMTTGQFQQSLQTEDVPTVSLMEYQAQLADVLGIPGNDEELARSWGVSGAVANASTRNRLLAEAFPSHSLYGRSGAIAEAYALSGPESLYGFGILNRNLMPWEHPTRGTSRGNYPLSDLRAFLGAYPTEGSVKMRVADTQAFASSSAITNFGTYLTGYAQMLNMDSGYAGFGHFMQNAGAGRAAADVRRDFGLIIPADDVDAFRRLLSDPTARDLTPAGDVSETPNYQRAEIRRIYDGLLRDAPINPGDGGNPITSVEQLDTALRDGRIGIMQHDMYLRQTGMEAAGRVHANTQFDMQVHRAFENAYRNIDQTLRPQAPEGAPILHTSTREATAATATSRSSIERFSNYLDRLSAVIPENTGALHVDVGDAPSLQALLSNPLGHDVTPTGRVSTKANFERSKVRAIYDAVLQLTPVTSTDGTRFDSIDSIRAAADAGRITSQEYNSLMQEVGRLSAAKVQPRTPDIVQAHEQAVADYNRRLAQYRADLDLTRAEISVRTAPEYMAALAHGGGWRGNFRAAGSFGGKGGVLGAFMGAGQEWYYGKEGDPELGWRMAQAAGREGLRGGSTAALETLAASHVSRYSLERGLALSANRALALRLASRFGPGAVIDPLFEAGSMLTDERANSSEEVSYRLGRAFVIGGTSALAGSYAGAAAGAAIGSVVPGVGTVIGFVVGLAVGMLVGAIASKLFPSYEELVLEQVPLKEFEKNIQAQSPRSLQNQILAQQEYDLLSQLIHGPEMRGPHVMADVYAQRNISKSPGNRFFAEALIGGKIHGGCMECHTRTQGAALEAGIPAWHPARMSPLDRLSMAAIEEFGNPQQRPTFMGYAMPETTVPAWMQRDASGIDTAFEMAQYINMIHPNIGAWRDAMGGNANAVIPQGLINRPMDEHQLLEYMQAHIDEEQAEFESHFGEVGDDEYELYRSFLEKAQK